MFEKNRNQCKDCRKIYKKNNYWKNIENIKIYSANYYSNNRESSIEYSKNYNRTHKEEKKEYQKKYDQMHKKEKSAYNHNYWKINGEKISAFRKEINYYSNYEKNRKNNDLFFKQRKMVSTSIRQCLNKNNSSKNGKSFLDFIPWSIEEYTLYMESQFSHPNNLTSTGKVWMTWKNQGVYRKDIWNDNDSETWKWQRDHIIPHSTFHYPSMDCQEFRDCWALSNLRPLSAKQNQLDGATKVRHKAKNNVGH